MRSEWKARLEALEQRAGMTNSGVVIFALRDEKPDDLADRIARWKAGETVEGINSEYREGTRYGVVRLVPSTRVH